MLVKDKLFSLILIQIVIVIALAAKCGTTLQTLDIQKASLRNSVKQVTAFADDGPFEDLKLF